MLQPDLSRVSDAPRLTAWWLLVLVTTRWKQLAFVLLPIAVNVACLPIVNWLGRIIRVNW